VHEDLPSQIESKEWVPRWARPVVRGIARGLYRVAERGFVLTLAEPGYQGLFARPHPVFANYPRSSAFPAPEPSGDGSAIYVGDITRARGIEEAMEATARAGLTLVAIGRVESTLAASLQAKAASRGMELTLSGHLANPVALERVSVASVGLSPLRDQPNYRGSLPTKTLEYLAMGVPVVATDLPGTRAVLGDLDAVWLVPPDDIGAMAVAIAQAVRPEAKTVAVEQAPRVREKFKWPEEEVRLFYASLINSQGTPSPS